MAEQDEGRRGLLATRVVQVIAREGQTPVGKHLDEKSISRTRLNSILEQVNQTLSSHRYVRGCKGAVEHVPPVAPHLQFTTVSLEFSSVDAAGLYAEVNAVAGSQVLWRLRSQPVRGV